MTTFEPCQQTLFDETECGPSMSSPAGSPVRTYHMLASELASKVNDLVCGRSSPDLLARFDPGSRSWKTCQACLVPGMDEFSATWPRSGMTLFGTAYPLLPSAPLTGGTGCGSWPTPRANDAETRGEIDPTNPRNGLPGAVRMWPTPAAHEARLGYQRRDTGKKGSQKSLTTIVIDEERRKAETFATPQSRDFRTGSIDRWNDPARSRNLNDQIGGSLNADWVEWLMGFPIGWTRLPGWKNPKTSPALPRASKTAPRG